MAQRLAYSRQFNSYGTIAARNSGTGIAQVFSVGDSAVTVGEAYLFTLFNYDGFLGPGFGATVAVSIHEVDENNYPIGDALVSDTFNVTGGVLAGGNDSSFKVWKHTVSLPLELEANKNYALVMLSTDGRVVFWVRFRSNGWLIGSYPKDQGSSNYVIVKLTENAGGTWDDWTQDYMCFEIWGPVTAPSVTTNPATSVTRISATLNGTLADDGGEASGCGFEWGLTDAYGETTPTQSRTTGQTFSQGIVGLSPGRTYHFRAKATNSGGTGYGADLTFTSQGYFAWII